MRNPSGKLERWPHSVKSEALLPANPATIEEAARILDACVQHYNCVRLHSAWDYITPLDYPQKEACA